MDLNLRCSAVRSNRSDRSNRSNRSDRSDRGIVGALISRGGALVGQGIVSVVSIVSRGGGGVFSIVSEGVEIGLLVSIVKDRSSPCEAAAQKGNQSLEM